MVMKSFRGLMTDGSIDTISLHTNTGSTGYKIVKFEILPVLPATVTGEHVVQIFKIKQAEPISKLDVSIDFADNTLL